MQSFVTGMKVHFKQRVEPAICKHAEQIGQEDAVRSKLTISPYKNEAVRVRNVNELSGLYSRPAHFVQGFWEFPALDCFERR